MGIGLTSSQIIASAKRRAQIPENQNTFSTDDFLAFANEEMHLGLVPSVLQLHEEYFLNTSYTNVLSNISHYPIPPRAIGNKLENLFFQDANKNLYPLTRIQNTDQPDYNGPYSASFIRAFRIEGNDIVLEPNIQTFSSGKLVFQFYMRPNDLVDEGRTATVTNVDMTTGQVSLSSVPSVFGSNSTFDFIQGDSPHIHVNYEISPVQINPVTKTVTFNISDLTNPVNQHTLKVGDYVCLAEETPIPQIPDDLHMVLAHRVASRCLEAMGDAQGLQLANAKLQEFEDKLQKVISNRVEGSPKKAKNKWSLIRSGLAARRYYIRGSRR